MSTKIILVFWILFFYSSGAFSQHTYSLKIIDGESQKPLPGATVRILELQLNEVSNEEGLVVFENIPLGTFTLEVRFLGYEARSLRRTFTAEDKVEILSLDHHHEEMEIVMVQSTRSSRVIEDIPTRVEVISGEELAEKGNMKPGDIRMLLNESTGIQTQQTSATSYNSSIRIQGLDGKYTQLLRDGLPLYSGYSGGLSLMQIPPLDLAQVEVIKGSASTLYGGGAIAGLVNLISKRPQDDGEIDLMINGTSALGLDISGFYSEKFKKIGTTVFAAYNKGTPYDPASIGLTAIPKFDRFTFNPKLFWNPTVQSELILGFNWTQEDRLGGNLDYIQGKSVIGPYFEENQTNRLSTQIDYRLEFGNSWNIQFKNSLNLFDRTISIPDYGFGGKQVSTFSEFNLKRTGEQSEWIGGLNLWTEKFTQTQGDAALPLDYQLNTFGVFLQNLWEISSDWTLESGFRMDAQQEYGVFALPKLSLLFEATELLTFRLGGGLGYKSPTVFTEEAERLTLRRVLPIDPSTLGSERSTGANLDANYRAALGEDLVLNTNVLFFYTHISNPLILTLNSDTTYSYAQPMGKLQTQGVEVNMKWEYRDLKLFLGYTFSDVNQTINQIKSPFPLVARHRLNNVLMYEKHENFRFGVEAYYFSPQVLNDGAKGKSYWIFGFMTEKNLGEHFSVFLNLENLLDARQTRFDTIFTGSISDPAFRDIYAPVDGFVINGGFKLHL